MKRWRHEENDWMAEKKRWRLGEFRVLERRETLFI